MRTVACSLLLATLSLALGCGGASANPGARAAAPSGASANALSEPAPRPAGAGLAPTTSNEAIDLLNTLPVSVVTEAPSAVYLLANLEEPNATDCEASLLRRARLLGANRLHVDRSQPGCRGGAYTVQTMPEGQGVGPDGRPEDYGKALHDWMVARWKRPQSISDAELRRLCVVMRIWTTLELRVWKVLGEPVKRSGNPAFDESVRVSLEAAIDEQATLPEPKSLETSRSVRNAMLTFMFAPGGASCR
jgi:hypothetical protein